MEQSNQNNIFKLAEEYTIDIQADFFQKIFISLKKEHGDNLIRSFLPLFPNVSPIFLEKLSSATNYYLISLLTIDHILDDKSTLVSKDGLMFSFLLREQALHLMYELFDSNSIYWDYFANYYKEYVTAIQIENQYYFDQSQITEMEIGKMKTMYAGKSALAKAVIAALAIQSDKLSTIYQLEKSMENFYIAATLQDDVNDWKLDFQNKQYSYNNYAYFILFIYFFV
jgi:hypothetical protein